MLKEIHIFDLDGTVIDSNHRALYDSVTGAIDLEHWEENSTNEKVMNDSLMPLARLWYKLIPVPECYIIVCTARVMGLADNAFLKVKGLKANKIFSRPTGNMEKDHVLKAKQLSSFLSLKQFSGLRKVMYDDNVKVREEISKLGINVFHPDEITEY